MKSFIHRSSNDMNKPQSGALFNDCAHLLTIYPRGVHFVLKQVSIFIKEPHPLGCGSFFVCSIKGIGSLVSTAVGQLKNRFRCGILKKRREKDGKI